MVKNRPKWSKNYFFQKNWKIDTKTFLIHFIGLIFDRNSLRYVIFNFGYFLRFSKKSIFLSFWSFSLVFPSQKWSKNRFFPKSQKMVKIENDVSQRVFTKIWPYKVDLKGFGVYFSNLLKKIFFDHFGRF